MSEQPNDPVRTPTPHQLPFFTRLLAYFGRQSTPVAALDSTDSDTEISGNRLADLAKWWQEKFTLSTDRTQRYNTYDEMDSFDMVAGVLDVLSEETTQPDYDKGVSVWVESHNAEMVEAAKACLHNLQLEDKAPDIVRRTCKMGDEFRQLIYAPEKGVLGWRYVSPKTMHRMEDKTERLVGFKVDGKKFRGARASPISWPWDFVHFRYQGSDPTGGYGVSYLASLFRPWRQATLAEDAMLMYRLRRSPDRNAVIVDVGDLEDHEAMEHVNNWRKRFRKQEYVDPSTPMYKKQFNPLTPLDDVFIPVRGPDNNTRIEPLSGAGNVDQISDLEYYINKFYGAARVPKSYMGWEGDLNSKCICMNTSILCLDGKVRTLREIVDTFDHTGALPGVYAFDTATDRFVPGRLRWAGVTKKNTQVVDVGITGGETIRCTPDHLFMRFDGSYCAAADLKPGDLLKTHPGEQAENHAVVAVLPVSETVDTGDITVDKYHNFVTGSWVVLHNSTLMQQDIRFARTCKRARRAFIYGVRATLEVHYALLGETFDTQQARNAFVVQMSPISYLDEFERLQLIELRSNITGALVGLGDAMKIDRDVWISYLLSHYLKFPDNLVMRMMHKDASAPPVISPEGVPMESEPFKGFYNVSNDERRRIDEALATSPSLRNALAGIRMYHADDIQEMAARQVDPSFTDLRCYVGDKKYTEVLTESVVEDTEEIKNAMTQVRNAMKNTDPAKGA